MAVQSDIQHMALAGEVTVFNAGDVRQKLLAALNGTDDVDVDLSQVTEIDTAGVQLIVAAKREAAERNKELHFSGCSPVVLDVMGLLGLSAYLTDAVERRV
ncbi:MAG: lipid asymmetry maintenance protein MlaB [Ignavibacteria bacterium]